MTDFTAGAPMDELMGQLAAVQARAAALAQGLQACEAELPDETQGTDPTGVARVQVGARGEPVGISFDEGWQAALAVIEMVQLYRRLGE